MIVDRTRRSMMIFLAAALSASIACAQQRLELDDQGRFNPAQTPKVLPADVDPALQKKYDEDAAVMSSVRRLLAEERVSAARSKIDDWIAANITEVGKAKRPNPYAPEAYLLRGDCKLADDDEYEALFDYEEIVKTFPASEQFVTALERELRVANLYLNGRHKRSLGLRIDDGTPISEEIIIRINERLPGSRLAERAMLDLADYYYRQRDLRSAADTYDVFLRLFPKSDQRQMAMQRRTYANIAQFKGPRYDAKPLIAAKFQIDQFQNEYPADAERVGLSDSLAARMDESLADQMLEQAKWYIRRDDLVSAQVHLARLMRKYPRSAAAASAATILEQRGWPKPPAPSPDENEKEAPQNGGADKEAAGSADAGKAPAEKPSSDKPPVEKPAPQQSTPPATTPAPKERQ